jgi:hypothetical protein
VNERFGLLSEGIFKKKTKKKKKKLSPAGRTENKSVEIGLLNDASDRTPNVAFPL